MEWVVKLIRKYQATPGLACAYGVVLYRDADAHVRGVIESDLHCEALNELSGSRWLIFASRARPKAPRTMKAMRFEFRGSISDEWHGSENKLALLRTLGLESERDLPCLLVMCAGEQDLAYVQHVKITGKSESEAFESLRESVKAVTEAIGDLQPQYLKTAESVHRVIETRLQADRHWRLAKASLPFLKKLLEKVLPAA